MRVINLAPLGCKSIKQPGMFMFEIKGIKDTSHEKIFFFNSIRNENLFSYRIIEIYYLTIVSHSPAEAYSE